MAYLPSPLTSLRAEEVLAVLDLDRPELAGVKASAKSGNPSAALTELLAVFRHRFPPAGARRSADAEVMEAADRAVRRVFQFGPYPPADYGQNVDWAADPAGDIEWVAAVQRFYWANALVQAYQATGDMRYPTAFVELTADWVGKHRLEDAVEREHPKYGWRGYPWLDIQTGIRAQNLCRAFRAFVHSDAFTPDFVALLLASLHDHQVKTMRRPNTAPHNKTMMEICGLVAVAATVPQFIESGAWLDEAARRAEAQLFAQVTPDGAQREWCMGYHRCVLKDATDIMDNLRTAGRTLSKEYVERLRRMYDYVFAMATPDMAYPMFGDTARGHKSGGYAGPGLEDFFRAASDRWQEPKYAARVAAEDASLPRPGSFAFLHAGHYVMRSNWGRDGIYLALHCPPPSLNQGDRREARGHDQPDNGTFELYAFGRWLMPDSGFYIYGRAGQDEARAWHRMTRVHQTMTLDGADSWVQGECLLWASEADFDALVVQNRSYARLTHRRTVWFVDRAFFVLLDEALGCGAAAPGCEAMAGEGACPAGELALHFQFAPGDLRADREGRWARTTFPDANVLVWQGADARTEITQGFGWTADRYGHRERRWAVAFTHHDPAPAAFLTLLVPYRGKDAPDVSARPCNPIAPGDDTVELDVTVAGKTWRIGRDLSAAKAWRKRN